MRGADRGPVGHELLRLQVGDWLVRQADLVELAVDLERGEVAVQVERVGHVGRVEHKVELERQRFGPVLVARHDELLGPEFERVRFFVGRVRDHRHVGAEGVGPQHGEVAESAEPDYGDVFSWSGACPHERGPDCQACAQHGRSQVGRDRVWDRENKVFMGPDVRGIAALRDGLIWVGLFRVG